ncbi:preprotein translocase subunit SecY [Thermosulfidibacter takaii ABI70S6]|uniref:Protein translocase subunit SecY n=1 Tax=Thermosulfidibacter takaii (strain DSM 17441 / JCM 13301 / NBRC 103674 / ABI70S6) TaxID=1298851 RepID=A0A0S3QV71_THET7|nr:preprotein translocase subunit SecY [Thermosulfidibacter takaii]BAT72202.1 preprotein translocase subunit SecY [Thermosulfidibacter takaii ABI70S6]
MRPDAENIFKVPELRSRILFTFFMLAVFRLGAHIPIPGINADALAEFFNRASGTLFGFFDLFSGGAFRRLTVFALGIMPYISAAIILELLTAVVPKLDQLRKEGERGRAQIIAYTRYGTILISAIQALGIAIGIQSMRSPSGMSIVINPGFSFVFVAVITMVAGTVFLMWIGEQINERGIGNGISLIIFAGIVARLPGAIKNTIALLKTGELSPVTLIVVAVLGFGVIAFICWMELAQRRVPINYPKRMVRGKLYGGQSSYLPIKVNISGVIPPIFASSILMFPLTVAKFVHHPVAEKFAQIFAWGTWPYLTVYGLLIIFFAYFYTAIIFNPKDVADNLRKYGGFIPGIRPGQKTAEYIERIVNRLTFVGALYLVAVCILPSLLIKYMHVPFYFGGTALLIVVGVALDTMQQIESHLIMRHYEGLMKRSPILGG